MGTQQQRRLEGGRRRERERESERDRERERERAGINESNTT